MNTKSFLLLPAVGLLVAACSSETSSTSGTSSGSSSSSGSTPVSTADCSTRCESKIKQCPSLADQAQQGCSQLCGAQLTEGQMTCLEGKTCEQFAQADSFNELCPAGSSSGGSSSGSSGTPSGLKKAGEACTCEGSGSGWQQCSSTSGPCEAGLVCFGIDGKNVCGSTCKNGEPCATGFTCTEEIYQGVSVGKYCEKE